MNYRATTHRLGEVTERLSAINDKRVKYLEAVGNILDSSYLKIYSAERQEAERQRINRDYLSALVSATADVKRYCTALVSAFKADTKRTKDTTEVMHLCISYLSLVGANYDCAYLERIGEPLRDANDFFGMRELHRLLESHTDILNGEYKGLPFSDIIPICSEIDELMRKISLLCDKITEQLPTSNIDIDAVAVSNPILDMWDIANLLDYAESIDAALNGRDYTPRLSETFKLDFNNVR